jgi:hypothetical protein
MNGWALLPPGDRKKAKDEAHGLEFIVTRRYPPVRR